MQRTERSNGRVSSLAQRLSRLSFGTTTTEFRLRGAILRRSGEPALDGICIALFFSLDRMSNVFIVVRTDIGVSSQRCSSLFLMRKQQTNRIKKGRMLFCFCREIGVGWMTFIADVRAFPFG